MTASQLRAAVVAARLEWLERMLVGIRSLPLDSVETFTADARNVASAESYLRRALEALLDFACAMECSAGFDPTPTALIGRCEVAASVG